MATLNELKTTLTERGIPFPEDAKKSELEELLANPPAPPESEENTETKDDFPTAEDTQTSVVTLNVVEDVAVVEGLPKGHHFATAEPIPHQPTLAELNREARAAWANVEREKLRKIVADAQKILEKNPGLMED